MADKIFPTDTSLVTTAWDDLIVWNDTSNPTEWFVEHTALWIAQTAIDDSSSATTKVWSASKSTSHVASGTVTMTNKSIDADTNTITNLEVDNLKAWVLDTDISTTSASDDTIPSAKATKTYADTKVSLTGDENVAWIKTFTSFPVTPSSDPTTDYQVSNKKYVDDRLWWYDINTWTVNTASATTTDITHNLWTTPKFVRITSTMDSSLTAWTFSVWCHVQSTSEESFVSRNGVSWATWSWVSRIYDGTSDYVTWAITTIDSTKITITWTTSWTPTGAGYLLAEFII